MPNKLLIEQLKDEMAQDERKTFDNLIREQVIHQ